ncbi:hypothetical protein TNCV_54981 [Trichonephila clavipes]|nr:hypothetical protein TNCV_54981 [Trichonephila clavipes]
MMRNSSKMCSASLWKNVQQQKNKKLRNWRRNRKPWLWLSNEKENLNWKNENSTKNAEAVTSQQLENPKLELNRIIPRFNSKEDEMGLYLTIFERQAKFLNIPEKLDSIPGWLIAT